MRIVVTGAGGMLARAVIAAATRGGHEVRPFDRATLDITDAARVLDTVGACDPDAVIHCAAYTRVDDAERECDNAFAVNAHATRIVADAAFASNAVFVYPSTDYVFDGRAHSPYAVDSPTAPLNCYGRSKLAGEAEAAHAGDHLVVRTSWLYGAGGTSFVRTMLERARAGAPLRVVDDQRGSPTWTSDLALTMLSLLERRAPGGVYHATSSGDTTWFGFASAIFEIAGIHNVDLSPSPSAEYVRPAQRPSYSVLDCSKTAAITGPMPHWRDSLTRALVEFAS